MDDKKIAQECRLVVALIIFSLVVCIFSIITIVKGGSTGGLAYVLGGAFFAFISGYGVIVCINRYIKTIIANRIGKMLDIQHIYKIRDIADKSGFTIQTVVKMINFLLENDYLSGYVITDNQVLPINTKTNYAVDSAIKEDKKPAVVENPKKINESAEVEQKTSSECKNCGATIVFVGKQTICPYCKTLIKSK